MSNLILNNKIFAFLKLIRIENLIMISLTMVLVRYFIIRKILNSNDFDLSINHYLYGLIVLSTVLIAAAGYIINDYFDVKTDLINHPQTVVVDKVLKRRWAIILHILFTVTGILLGIYCALKTGYLRLALFHLLSALLLWFYSTHFKKQLLVGNLVVSILSASVVFMPLIFEMGLMQKLNPDFVLSNYKMFLSAFKATFVFALFAFFTTLTREIIKDIEDIEGDRATGCKTMPIKWGTSLSKTVIFFLIVITIILLVFMIYNSIKANMLILTPQNIYIVLLLILPLSFLIFRLVKANTSRHYYQCSIILKLVMLSGLMSTVIF